MSSIIPFWVQLLGLATLVYNPIKFLKAKILEYEIQNNNISYEEKLYYLLFKEVKKIYNKKKQIALQKEEERLRKQKDYWIKYWSTMRKNGFEFEKAISNLYQKLKYKVTLTKGTGDGGVDLILEKNNIITIVQCKAHKNPVGPAPVIELWGVKDDFKATSAIFIAYAGVTSGAYDFARNKKLEIIDVNKLIEMSIEVEKRQQKNKK